MERHDGLLIGMIAFVAVAGLTFSLWDNSVTGEAYGSPPPYYKLAKAPYTDLPYDGQPLEMPFAGRCYRDEGKHVVYATVRHQDVEHAFDGCYTAADGADYYYDYSCKGDDKISQIWVTIYPGC